jgi:hypothetical protein
MAMDSTSFLMLPHTKKKKKTEKQMTSTLENSTIKKLKICVQIITIVSTLNVFYKDVSFNPSLFQVRI